MSGTTLTLFFDCLCESPRRLILIAGARQVGKTTVIEQTREKLDRDLLLVRVDEPGSRYLPTAATALERFREQFHPVKAEVVGGDGVPLEEFLSIPADDWFKT